MIVFGWIGLVWEGSSSCAACSTRCRSGVGKSAARRQAVWVRTERTEAVFAFLGLFKGVDILDARHPNFAVVPETGSLVRRSGKAQKRVCVSYRSLQ